MMGLLRCMMLDLLKSRMMVLLRSLVVMFDLRGSL